MKKDTMSKLRMIFSLLVIGFIFSCAQQPEEAEDTYSKPAEDLGAVEVSYTGSRAEDDSDNLFAAYFSDEIIGVVDQIKTEFESGIRLPSEADSSLAYLYRQHARRLRLQFMDQDPILPLFPFNGKLLLSDRRAQLDQLPFMSYLCGFQRENGESVHYYCPSLDQAYFQYLEEVGLASSLIAQFVSDYQENKSLSANMRQLMLMNSIEDLDFGNYDHQLFYCLFQLWVADEMQAYLKI